MDAPPRCFESASTTDVSLTSTRRKNTLFGDCPPSAVGKPAGVPLRDPPRAPRHRCDSGGTPDHLAVIRPPTASCLTARRRLRVERLPLRRFRAGRGRAQRHCLPLHASPVEPSDASGTTEKRNARALLFPFGDPASTGRTSMLPAFAGSRRLPPGKSISHALAGTRMELRARWPAGAGAARVHRCSKTSTRPFSAPLSRAFPGRMRFHDFCRSMFQRALLRAARTSRPAESVVGTAACFDRSSPFDRGNRRRYSGSGAEDHRASAFPPGTAPGRGFAPTPIASDTSCRGHCPPPCQELTRDADEAAGAAHASKA